MARSNGRRYFKISLRVTLIWLGAFALQTCSDYNDGKGFSDEILTDDPSISIFGQTQGTTYTILCSDKISISQKEIDSLLANFDQALSTYIPNSIISKFNKASAGSYVYTDRYGYFNQCFSIAQNVYESTNGAFDPSVFPLLDIWGFLKKEVHIPDSLAIEKILRITGFKPNYHYVFKPNEQDTLPSKLIKRTPDFKVVFNAIAQGQAVDVLCDFLELKGARNYFVEIGGEVRVRGANSQGNIWSIGIDKPIENSTRNNRELMTIVSLDGKAIATSGNYRQFYEKNGIKYAHTLNPQTGYPVNHQLLSATVVSNSCAIADAYATAFMVMGTEASIAFVNNHKDLGLELMLIYNKGGEFETYTTQGFQNIIKS